MRFFICLFFLLLSSSLFANETLLERHLKMFDRQFDPVEDALHLVANRTDAFFSGDSNEVKTVGKSHVTMRFSVEKMEGRDVLYDVKVKAHLDLPKTKDRLKLVFSSDEEDDFSQNSGNSKVLDNIEEKDYLLGLRFSKPLRGPYSYYIQAGLKLHSPIDPYIRLKLRYYTTLWQNVDFIARQTFSYFYHRFFENKSSLQWRKEFMPHWFVSHSDAFIYKNKKDEIETIHAFELEHLINNKNAIALNLSAHLFDDPETSYGITYYESRLGYRHLITDAFVLEAVPSLIFHEDTDFSPRLKVKLSLIYQFGNF